MALVIFLHDHNGDPRHLLIIYIYNLPTFRYNPPSFRDKLLIRTLIIKHQVWILFFAYATNLLIHCLFLMELCRSLVEV